MCIRDRRRRDGFVVEYLRPNREDTDKLISIAGRQIRSTDDYQAAMDSQKPGDVVEVVCERAGVTRTVRIPLGIEQ